MPEYKVNTQQLRACAGQLENMRTCLDNVAAKLALLQLDSALRISTTTPYLIARLKDCKAAAMNQSLDLQRLSNGMESAAGIYDRYETKLKEPQTVQQAAAGEKNESPFWDNLFDIVGDTNALTSLITGIYHFAQGDAKGVWGGVKDVSGVASNILSKIGETKGTADWAKELLGINKTEIKSFSECLTDKLDDYKISGKGTAGKAAAVANWVQVGVSGILNGMENYDEFNGEMDARFWGETVIETAVDVGVGIGVSAALTAAAGAVATAAGVAGAPALLIGAATGVVVWAANGVCKKITGGRDLGEVVADAVCDAADAATRCVKQIGKEITDSISTAWNSFCCWVGA